MEKVLKWFVAFFLIINTTNSMAQKPMDVKMLSSKVDSLLAEANEVYSLLYAALTAEKIATNQINLKYKWVLEIYSKDSIEIKFLNDQKIIITSMTFLDNYTKPKIKNNLRQSLSNYEDSLFDIKRQFFAKIDSSKYIINPNDSIKHVTLMIPFEVYYKIYQIRATNKENIIPFGGDKLYVINKNSELLISKTFHTNYIPMKTIVRGHKVRHVVPKYTDNETYILPVDIALFRYYADDRELNSLTVFPPRSKRYFSYNSKLNKLRVHTTPSN
nr:hypothetical protein [Allomuricauda sp.]